MHLKLTGKRTYIVCSLAVLWAISGVLLGYLQPQESVNIVLAALGAAGLRASK